MLDLISSHLLRSPMYLLVSGHGFKDIPLRLYVSREAALAHQLYWKPGSTDSSFLGFELIGFHALSWRPFDIQFFDTESTGEFGPHPRPRAA
jgi:hypothetical protein